MKKETPLRGPKHLLSPLVRDVGQFLRPAVPSHSALDLHFCNFQYLKPNSSPADGGWLVGQNPGHARWLSCPQPGLLMKLNLRRRKKETNILIVLFFRRLGSLSELIAWLGHGCTPLPPPPPPWGNPACRIGARCRI